MSVTTAETIRPFTIPVATRAELQDLRARIENTRGPDREPVSDHSQGVQLEVMRELARYWAGPYNWRKYKAPRSWTERAYPNLVYFNEVDRGGHFAAWQEPELFSAEVRTGFRPLR